MAPTNRRLHWMSVVFPDSIDFPGNEGLIVPSGTTAERPSVPTNGLIRYNISGGILEAYINGIWENLLGTGGGTGNEFIDLIDTFPSYTGRGNHLLKVNAAETEVESWDIGSGFLPNAGGTMDSSANITMNGGELLGLPATPSVPNAATSKTYVDGLVGGTPSKIEDSTTLNVVDTEYAGGTSSGPGIGIFSSKIGNLGAGGGVHIRGGISYYTTTSGVGSGGAIRIEGGGGIDGPGAIGDNDEPGGGGVAFLLGGAGGNNTLSPQIGSHRGGNGGDVAINGGKGGTGFYAGNGGVVRIHGGTAAIGGAGMDTAGGSIYLSPGGGNPRGILHLGASNLTFPNFDGNTGEVLTTDGAGNLSFSANSEPTKSWSGNLSPSALPVGNPSGTGERLDGVQYTNNTGASIVVNVICQSDSLSMTSYFNVDAVTISRYVVGSAPAPGATVTHTVTVPGGSTYRVGTGTADYTWYELS